MAGRLLILNGSHSEVPLIQAAVSLGYEVITTGNEPGLVGHRYGARYVNADYSNFDAVLKVAKDFKVDRVCSCANDFGIITAARVCDELGLPGHDSAQVTRLLHTKDLFKKFALEQGLSVPLGRWFSELSVALSAVDGFRFPVIVKPVDLTGGKGVSIAYSEYEYSKAVKKAFDASRKHRIVVEEFVEGQLCSFSTFVVNKKVAFYYSDNEFCHFDPFGVSASFSPAWGVEEYRDELVWNVEKIAQTLNLVDGIFHIQYILSNRGVYIIDITRRCSGDMYPVPVQQAMGIDWARLIVLAETGERIKKLPKINWQPGCHGRYCVVAQKPGRVSGVFVDPAVEPYVVDKFFWWKKGEMVEAGLQKIGIVFVKYPTAEIAYKVTKSLPDLIFPTYMD